MRLANSHDRAKNEPFWHVQFAIVLAMGFQLLLNPKLVFASKYIIVALELVLLLIVSFAKMSDKLKRAVAIGLIAVLAVANISSLGFVVVQLLTNGTVSGKQLLLSSVAIYLTNIILFGILYWELDNARRDEPDFLFSQFTTNRQKAWYPTFYDYLYISITNATAFSPTDTLPLTHRAKLLMSIHALVSLITVALVAARAVNILG
ncbi:MAG: hypothetical protein QFB86_01805 [Patescibacteria group bacterium]|nr:hypothetical protein [Patescibacteria group bacterium]